MVSPPPPLLSRPYYDYEAHSSDSVVIVGAGAVVDAGLGPLWSPSRGPTHPHLTLVCMGR